ncbi:MAG: hypothetical protein WAS50_13065, partial [Nitrospira sp.]
YEGESFDSEKTPMIRARGNPAAPGMSGSPLVNRRTRGVCGVIVVSGAQHIRGISISNAIRACPELLVWQQRLGESEEKWVSFLPKTICLEHAARHQEGLIRYELNGRDVGTSPLAEYWKEFINCETWSGFIADLVNRSKDLSEKNLPLERIYTRLSKIETKGSHNSILASLRKANFDGMYEEVVNILNDLIAEYESLRPSDDALVAPRTQSHRFHPDKPTPDIRDLAELKVLLGKLRDEFNRPTFQNLFLVCGSLGSGKTHFISSLGARCPEGGSKLYIPIFPNVSQGRACAGEQWLLPEIRKATSSDWRDIGEFDEYLRAQHPPVQMVVVMDNIDDYLGDNVFRENFKQTIEDLSEFSSIRWVLTADYLSLGKVSRSMPENYWKNHA